MRREEDFRSMREREGQSYRERAEARDRIERLCIGASRRADVAGVLEVSRVLFVFYFVVMEECRDS